MIPLCSNCRWYRRIDEDIGTCRGALPIPVPNDDDTQLATGEWPTVEPTDVCAHHTLPHRSLVTDLRLAVATAAERRARRRVSR